MELKLSGFTKSGMPLIDIVENECRKCYECADQEHHWIETEDGICCKHCEIRSGYLCFSDMEDVQLSVILTCTEPGCKAFLHIAHDSEMPEGTAFVEMPCPKHVDEGNKGVTSKYFDENHNLLDVY